MRRLVLVLAILALPTPALALGFGTTFYAFERDRITDEGAGIPDRDFAFPRTYPSLDLAPTDAIYVQLHLFELIHGLIEERAIVGAAGYYNLGRPSIGGPLSGVLGVGASVDLDTLASDYEDAAILIQGLGRIGFTVGDELKLGLFIVPGLGFAVVPVPEGPARTTSKVEMVLSGSLQLSAWLP